MPISKGLIIDRNKLELYIKKDKNFLKQYENEVIKRDKVLILFRKCSRYSDEVLVYRYWFNKFGGGKKFLGSINYPPFYISAIYPSFDMFYLIDKEFYTHLKNNI